MFVSELFFRFLDFLFVEIFLSQVNGVVDERAVLLDELFELFVGAVFGGIFLEMESDQGAALEFDGIVFFNGEGVGGGTGPFVLEVAVVFWDDLDSRGDQERGVESDTELSDQVDISGLEVFKEISSTGLGYSTQIGDEFVFGHTDAVIDNFQDLLIGIKLHFNFELSFTAQNFWFLDGQKPDFIEGVWGVTDEFPEEDLFLCVEGVDDDIH